MKEFIQKNIKIISLLVIVILLSAIGLTFAYTMDNINVNIGTGEYAVIYNGTSRLPSSNLTPILDSELTSSSNSSKVLKIDFTVKGAQTNPTNKPIIYDVSLTELNLPKELQSELLKWRLYKNGTQISEGNFSKFFDEQKDNRMVLTETQQDLPNYNSNADSYVFYIWISESCTGNILTCTEEDDTSHLINKTFSGNIRIELSTGNKKEIQRLSPALTTIVNLGLTDSIQTDTPNFAKVSYSTCDTENDTTCERTVGIYSAEDDLGTSYYFRGDVENNYVKFADKYWRIIRINGDGTVRMIFAGLSAFENGYSGDGRNVGSSSFNSPDISYRAVGYMYGEQTDNEYDSLIKEELEGWCTEEPGGEYCEPAWYGESIVAGGYHNYVADAIYCNDRSYASDFVYELPVGAHAYGPGGRLYEAVNPSPSLKCIQINDRFTIKDSTLNGVLGGDASSPQTNNSLKAPVGLITADEVALAGGVSGKNNTNYYLYNGETYWTMSPALYEDSARVFAVSSDGRLIGDYVDGITNNSVVPVISLKEDVLIYNAETSNGSMEHPFVLK